MSQKFEDILTMEEETCTKSNKVKESKATSRSRKFMEMQYKMVKIQEKNPEIKDALEDSKMLFTKMLELDPNEAEIALVYREASCSYRKGEVFETNN
ncbi:hypothetical protein D1007_58347 [Hordeum vulgare]|nr:hypothetical protein D1007_58347 [Hordeum vulgare]